MPIEEVWLNGDPGLGVPGQRRAGGNANYGSDPAGQHPTNTRANRDSRREPDPSPARYGDQPRPDAARFDQSAFDPSAFDPGPELPPLPVLRPLPLIRPLGGWLSAPTTPAAFPAAVPAPTPATTVQRPVPPADNDREPPARPVGSKTVEMAESPTVRVAGVPQRPDSGTPASAPPNHTDRHRVPDRVDQPHRDQPTRRRRRAPEPIADESVPSSTEAAIRAAPDEEPFGAAQDVPQDNGRARRAQLNAVHTQRRRVLVLGGSGTVGGAVVRALAAQGARIAVHSASRPDEAARLINTIPGDGHLSVAADLSDAEAVAGLIKTVDEAFDGLDVVINAASSAESGARTGIVGSSLSDWTDAWTSSLTVDVLGAATVAHAAAAAFVARGRGGRIILLAARGRPFMPARSPVTVATEQSVVAMGAALATELSVHGIGVTVIGSGSAASSGWSPELLADTVAWLASGPASSLPGAVVNVAG